MVKNDIKVYARLKPEWSQKNITNHEVYHRPKGRADEDFLILTAPPRICNEYIDNRPESWNFSFFKIFEETAEQEIIFNEVAKPVIHSVLNGYNGTIFAYGQTGSGKTYTITGEQNSYDLRGILPRTLQYLFTLVKKQTENLYSIEISYLEIYNENGYDLLNRKQEWSLATKIEDLPRVTIQEDETGTLHLKNLSFWPVTNEKDALDLLFIGDTNRVVSETPMNPMSSRSHCIFTIIVSMKKFGSNHYSRAKMHLVDLAGSERVYKCAITGTILTEAKHINLSLHYLEQVIVCLGQQNANHIPYRNSLLTAILRDSLGGNCLTTMLATLSLSIQNLEETISTCRFAQRVALVKNDVNLCIQHDIHSENTLLKMENEQLKKQIEILKNQLVNQSPRELNEDEKEYLDKSVEEFLELDEHFKYTNDPRKLHYCLEILKGKFKLHDFENGTKTICPKSSEYYKNLILQRDKEISLLINMLKKEKKKFSKQKLPKENFQEKKSENLKENSNELLNGTLASESIMEHTKETPKETRTSIQNQSNPDPNQINEEMNPNLENNLISLTPQDICQLKNLISMYNGHILSYHQSLVSEKKHSDKVSNEYNFATTTKLNSNKQENLFQSIDTTGKTLLENKMNSSENFKKFNKNLLLTNKSNESREKIKSLRNEHILSVPIIENLNNSEKFLSTKKSHCSEVTTLNLFQIVKEDLPCDVTNSKKSKKYHRSKHSSRNKKKEKLKNSNNFNLLSEFSSKESIISVERKNSDVKMIVNANDSVIRENFQSAKNNNNENIIQGGGDAETIVRSKDFVSILKNEELLLKNHIDDAKDQINLGFSVKLESSRSTPSVKSEAHSVNVTRLSELSRNSICINNNPSHSFNNSNVEFLNSSQREISSSSSSSSSSFLSSPSSSSIATHKNSANLMDSFQSNIDTRITCKSFDLSRQKQPCLISNDSENSINIEQSAKELEERLLSKDDDNLEEELIRMTENLSLNSERNSLRNEEGKEIFNFDKSLPLTGDPDIDEEIIAFYKAKRAGGTY
ncbi:kinesin-like protein KIF3B isoform X2 [Leptopilina boulardi]|uniref:kinesin-like protein KIF3B isoform X2 n=1 Tax=Leptopilina boulardi TaxID=63433 RepID=UPI0021F521A4|nr:kinesin-like protein KIF3B isoform X2 [Leptopilina boulardi]